MTLVNQQERSLEYVAGVVDGEGSFSIMAGRQGNNSFYVLPVIQLSMLHHETVLEVAQILKNHGVGCYLHDNQKRGCLSLAIKGYKRCKNFLSTVGPYLLTKREQALIMDEFVESRLSRMKGSAPTPREVTLIEKIRASNSHQSLPRKPLDWLHALALEKSSETIRLTPTGEDIVHATR